MGFQNIGIITDSFYYKFHLFYFFRRRERARKKKYECSKCMYALPPFKPHFDPNEHNNYMKRWFIIETVIYYCPLHCGTFKYLGGHKLLNACTIFCPISRAECWMENYHKLSKFCFLGHQQSLYNKNLTKIDIFVPPEKCFCLPCATVTWWYI